MPADEEAQVAGGEPAEPRAASDSPAAASEEQPAAQELGRVERPPADRFQGKRRLLLVPLLLAPPSELTEADAEPQAIYDRYWDQVRTQVDALASALGGLHRIYHESMMEGGEAGMSYLEMADPNAYALSQVRFQAGATLEATESFDLISECLDLQRCLMLPLTNEGVATRLQQWLAESTHGRYEHIAGRIDQTLQVDETGLLLIGERHQVQFPADIEVFYVAPPALDEYRRWLQNWAAAQQRVMEADMDTAGEESDDEQA
jgi:hypothetical protein